MTKIENVSAIGDSVALELTIRYILYYATAIKHVVSFSAFPGQNFMKKDFVAIKNAMTT